MRPYFYVVALPLVVSGCASTLPPEVIASGGFEASSASVRPISYASPFSGYNHRQPVDPKPWRQQNDAQSPEGGES
ncbi:hypothetical protein [Rhizobium sp. GN54]|uniref:hypothetical protein n=1 Tax=Rhizobium sp. GN54 TaxID=2898150 RepID=UPI001E3B7F0C|nr:hypothetical protein [Rhizobium sp. GN54]MCD2185435.1 hypothetical protein [Rhizobium sp. GN54]